MTLIPGIGRILGEPERPSGTRFPGAIRLLAACLGLALLGGCAGRTAAPEAASAPATVPFFWRATGPTRDAGVIYLLGSVHVGRPEFLDFATPVEAAFAGASELVVEVDLAALSARDLARKMSRYVMLPAGERLRDRISPGTYAALVEHVADSEISMAAIDRMKPWAAATVLEMSQFAAAGLEEAYGIDRYFVERAKGRIAIRGLETFESQSLTFDSLSAELQELMLADSIRSMDEDPGDVVDAWVRGDESALTRQIMEPMDLDPRYAPFYEAVFFARNETMAADLASLSRDGKIRFAVVGAGHLVGPRGIPTLLSERGFRVERVRDR